MTQEQQVWQTTGEGFAVGPSIDVVDGERVITVQALWTDEQGVLIDADYGDEPIPARIMRTVCEAALQLAETPAPEVARCN